MYCRNCGTEISDDSKFCRKCGMSVIDDVPYAGMYGGERTAVSPKNIPSTYFAPTLVLMIAAIVFGLYLAIPFSITAFVLACVARKQYLAGVNEQGAKYAKLAKIFMWVGVALMIVTIILLVVVMVNIMDALMEPIMEIMENYPKSEWVDRVGRLVEDYMMGAFK